MQALSSFMGVNSVSDLQIRILEVTIKIHPMCTVYGVCASLGERQQSSKQKFYVRVYRALEGLVASGHFDVMRGIRDPSVYLNRSVLSVKD
jgi:hypothetical protein